MRSLRSFEMRTTQWKGIASHILLVSQVNEAQAFAKVFPILIQRSHHSAFNGSQARPNSTSGTRLPIGALQAVERRQCFVSSFQFASGVAGLQPLLSGSKWDAKAYLTPDEASRRYDAYAATYNKLDGGPLADMLGIDRARSLLLSNARGRTLEIGAGTGLNLDRYTFRHVRNKEYSRTVSGKEDVNSGVTSLILVDISKNMLQEAHQRAESLGIVNQQLRTPLHFIQGDVTSSELLNQFGANSFDTAVDTFTLCVLGYEGAKKCLQQLKRLVKSREKGGASLRTKLPYLTFCWID